MAVVVNDGAAVGNAIPFRREHPTCEMAAGRPARAITCGFIDIENAAAFGDDARGRSRIDSEIVA